MRYRLTGTLEASLGWGLRIEPIQDFTTLDPRRLLQGKSPMVDNTGKVIAGNKLDNLPLDENGKAAGYLANIDVSDTDVQNIIKNNYLVHGHYYSLKGLKEHVRYFSDINGGSYYLTQNQVSKNGKPINKKTLAGLNKINEKVMLDIEKIFKAQEKK